MLSIKNKLKHKVKQIITTRKSVPSSFPSIESTKSHILNHFLEGCQYQHFPYPHLVVDNLIDAAMLQDINKYWPSHELFFESGIIGEYSSVLDEVLPRMPVEMRRFWSDFRKEVMSSIIKSGYSLFEDFFIKKYKIKPRVAFPIVLMEVGNTYSGHEIHTHHYHDPLWLFTNLLYVKQFDEEVPGTSLFGLKDEAKWCASSQAAMAAKTLQWDDLEDIQLKKTVDFKEGRLFSFLDSPISYHGVIPPANHPAGSAPSKLTRRIVKSHVRFEAQFPEEIYQNLYGVYSRNYALERRRSSSRPHVVQWLQNEIEGMLEVAKIEKPITLDNLKPKHPVEFCMPPEPAF